MTPTLNGNGKVEDQTFEKLAYVRQMLGELRGVASTEKADMLCYLIEMAFVEAGDILSGKRQLSHLRAERYQPTGMPVKSTGKV